MMRSNAPLRSTLALRTKLFAAIGIAFQFAMALGCSRRPVSTVVGSVTCSNGYRIEALDSVERRSLGHQALKRRIVQLIRPAQATPHQLRTTLAPYEAWRHEVKEPRVVIRGLLKTRQDNVVIRPSGIAEGGAPTVLSIYLNEQDLAAPDATAARACIERELDGLILALGKHKVFTGESDVAPFDSLQYSAVVLWRDFPHKLTFRSADGQEIELDRNDINWRATTTSPAMRKVGVIGQDANGHTLIVFDARPLKAAEPAGKLDLDFASYLDVSGNTVRAYFAAAKITSAADPASGSAE